MIEENSKVFINQEFNKIKEHFELLLEVQLNQLKIIKKIYDVQLRKNMNSNTVSEKEKEDYKNLGEQIKSARNVVLKTFNEFSKYLNKFEKKKNKDLLKYLTKENQTKLEKIKNLNSKIIKEIEKNSIDIEHDYLKEFKKC